MATVTALLDRAARITGLRVTGTERALALAALQDAYDRALIDAEASLSTVSYTFVASTDSYVLATILGAVPSRLTHVSMTGQGQDRPLQQTSAQELQDTRAIYDETGTPYLYATAGFEKLMLYPNPAVGDVVNVWYIPTAPVLVETAPTGTQESTPSKIPAHFHNAVLLPGMVLEMLDKDQRIAESQTWQERYAHGIARLQEHMGQMGGTANRAYNAKQMGRTRFNDQRNRFG